MECMFRRELAVPQGLLLEYFKAGELTMGKGAKDLLDGVAVESDALVPRDVC